MSLDSHEVKPALILDLDGTIRFNGKDPSGFINHASEVAVFDDVEPKLWKYKDSGWLVFGVTNQGGVAHGYKTMGGVDEEIQATVEQFDRNPFDDVVFAPSMASGNVEPYCHRSFFRKPEIGLLALLEDDWMERGVVVDWNNSLIVGNSNQDEDLARNAKIPFKHAAHFFGRSG